MGLIRKKADNSPPFKFDDTVLYVTAIRFELIASFDDTKRRWAEAIQVS